MRHILKYATSLARLRKHVHGHDGWYQHSSGIPLEIWVLLGYRQSAWQCQDETLEALTKLVEIHEELEGTEI